MLWSRQSSFELYERSIKLRKGLILTKAALDLNYLNSISACIRKTQVFFFGSLQSFYHTLNKTIDFWGSDLLSSHQVKPWCFRDGGAVAHRGGPSHGHILLAAETTASFTWLLFIKLLWQQQLHKNYGPLKQVLVR